MATTTTGTGITFRQIVALMVIAALAAVVWKSGIGRPLREENQEQAVFSAVWEPNTRKLGQVIKITVEGVEVVNTIESKSPWNTSIWIPKGARYEMTVQQLEDGHLDCLVQINGEFNSMNHRDAIGTARCLRGVMHPLGHEIPRIW